MAHHGDYVCGRGCVSARRNSRTIPSVQNLQGGSFCPAVTLISVILLKQNQDYTPPTLSLGYFLVQQVTMTIQDCNTQHKHTSNTTTMVVAPPNPPAACI
jgi:hypothetical protein